MTAREYLDGVARAAADLRAAESLLAYGPPRGGGCARGPASGDPTVARLLADEAARARADAAREVLGEASRRIGWLRRLYSRKADVLELRYVRLLGWAEVAAELGVSEGTARRWRDELADWVDSFGWARAATGRGVAEG